MFGPMYQQMMKSRLGVGKPLEGYGGFSQQGGVTPPPTPWGPQDGASLPAPSPWLHQKDNMGGATLPAPSPWLHQGSPRTTPFEPRPRNPENMFDPRQTPYESRGGGIEGGPFGPPHPKPDDAVGSGATGMGYMGGMRNPWQRY